MLKPARSLLLASSVTLVSLVAVACAAPTDSWTDEPSTPAEDDTGSAPAEDDTGSAPADEDTGTAPTMKTDTGARTDSASPAMDTSVADTTKPATDSSTGDPCMLPPRDCTGALDYCGALVPFEPKLGPGYDDYPINGETSSNQYRSYCRRDLMMLVKYASAFVECKAKGWTPGNGAPIGLGDMSEKTGAIPGTSIGSPGHPSGTHTNGYDMDIAYYQTAGTNNYLRSVCPHTSGGVDQYHCTGEPTILDVKRTALFLGAFLTSDRTRVIGVDGKIGPLVLPALQKLCDDGTLPKLACDRKGYIAYETTNTGKGWYQFHHHHLHISLKKLSADYSFPVLDLAPGNPIFGPELQTFELGHVFGHAHVE